MLGGGVVNQDLDNHILHTKSQKLARVSILKNYIAKQIDENQSIKRLCRYLTTTPLHSRGLTYDGYKVNQPDLVDSLFTPVVNDRNVQSTEDVLVPYPFSEMILNEQRITIYVHSPKTSFNTNRGRGFGQDDLLGTHLFLVEVVFPTTYDRIDPYGEERHLMIASEILNLFDGTSVDEDLRPVVGDITFRIVGDMTTLRLNKVGYLVTTIPIETTVPSMRVDEHRLSY